jgi:hypothetical protein
MLRFLQETVQRECFFAEARNEMAECRQATYDPLYALQILDGYEFDIFCGLEAVGMAFWVGNRIGEAVEVCSQDHRLQNSLAVLDALDVTLVGLFI